MPIGRFTGLFSAQFKEFLAIRKSVKIIKTVKIWARYSNFN